MRSVVRIGTRRSRLARWQAKHIAELLVKRHPTVRVEIQEFSSRGDQHPSTPLPAIGVKGLFTEALEAALRRGEIDCAVHSLKDLPVEEAAGLAIAAVPRRGDHRDVLVSSSGAVLSELPAGARIGTGSLRRRAQLLALRPDLKLLPIRGNVPARLDKLFADGSKYDAIVLAAAGLERLGLGARISEVFTIDRVVSAAGQGALALQCRQADAASALFSGLTERETAWATTAERAFLGALAGGCSAPVGAYATLAGNSLQLQARVLSVDGAKQINVSGETSLADEQTGAIAATELGQQLAAWALAEGARQLLDEIVGDNSMGDER